MAWARRVDVMGTRPSANRWQSYVTTVGSMPRLALDQIGRISRCTSFFTRLDIINLWVWFISFNLKKYLNEQCEQSEDIFFQFSTKWQVLNSSSKSSALRRTYVLLPMFTSTSFLGVPLVQVGWFVGLKSVMSGFDVIVGFPWNWVMKLR